MMEIWSFFDLITSLMQPVLLVLPSLMKLLRKLITA